ncbi:MAG TPA: hypothetical protein VLF69_03895 [Candidatus Saccharimonadales bacterium]|nr:hypothetical protein [Candidatus Saccharimonadales bacterium]
MYKLKDVARRGIALAGAAGLLAGVTSTAIPAFVSADDLNPLTERSLTLSSSSPGWAFTDGSGNSTYAGPNTGTNGLKTGNTFSFRTSSSATIKAFTFQYCTSPAGLCAGPGNDTPEVYDVSDPNPNNWTVATPRGSDTTSTSDLVTHVDGTTNAEVAGADYATLSADGSATSSGGSSSAYGDLTQVPDGQDVVSPYDESAFGHADNSNGIDGNFVVLTGSSATGYVNTYSGGWSLSASNQEEATIDGITGATTRTAKNNMLTLTNTTGVALAPGDFVKIIFFGTDKNYITNPGQGAFFVKINDYDTTTSGDLNPTTSTHIIDGGVTVANVMNESIQIQTKVLETMDFSVGTVDPDTLTPAELSTATSAQRTAHGQCDPILTGMNPSDPHNTLVMGYSDGENSLQTDHTFATHSYWRLSSNSSGGATVYYAGNTLSNTEGDKIAPIGTTAAFPLTGSEQFGLALDNVPAGTNANEPVSYTWAETHGSIDYESGADASAASGGAALDSTATTGWVAYQAANSTTVHNPQLAPLVPTTAYGLGQGGINSADTGGITSKYAYDLTSQTVPTPIASESTQVVNCVTGKMRYIGNIAATTPAGIYTTKINYIAAPQY